MSETTHNGGRPLGGELGEDPAALSSQPVLSPRAFWMIFGSSWGAFGGLIWSSQVLMGGYPPGKAALSAALEVLILGLPSAVLAWNRAAFLAPRRSTRSFVGHKLAIGAVFALVIATQAGVLNWLVPLELAEGQPVSPGRMFVGFFLFGLLVYTVQVFFLMWADAVERAQASRALAAREAVLRAQAESKALRAQFNPHFVFNTLHSLMLLVRKEPETAEQAIEDVAGLIRYASTLQRQEIDQVSLGKELEFARRYIALEKLRLADRLQVEWTIEPGLEDALVPAFSLQTLLENSIKHGIAPSASGGTVSIRAAVEGSTLSLSVEDDGNGTDPAAVSQNGGSGLDLLTRRLDSVYGDDGSLAWDTQPGAGFRVTVRVPVRRAPTAQAAPVPV